MMHKKGQGAMEYLMTYGWAILVVVIVGVVLWQMGVFSGGGSSATTFTGFGVVKPVEWSCSGDTITLTMTNGAGGAINNVTVAAETSGAAIDCTGQPASVPAGGTVVCPVTLTSGITGGCYGATSGTAYASNVSIGYMSPTGQSRVSSGTVRGPVD